MPRLTIDRLRKRFGQVEALREATFRVEPGEVLGLLGPNGAGKSTLLACIAGLMHADKGDVRGNDGTPIAPDRRRDALMYLPDGIAPWRDQPTEWIVAIWRAVAGSRDEGWTPIARVLGLDELRDYLTVRFNGTEDNLVLWTFNEGKRSFVKRAPENVPLDLGTWHELKIAVHGTQLTGFVDGKALLDYTLKEPVSGKVGLWSKTDSMTEFADFTVTPADK